MRHPIASDSRWAFHMAQMMLRLSAGAVLSNDTQLIEAVMRKFHINIITGNRPVCIGHFNRSGQNTDLL